MSVSELNVASVFAEIRCGIAVPKLFAEMKQMGYAI